MAILTALLLTIVFMMDGCSNTIGNAVEKVFTRQSPATITENVKRFTITIGNHSFIPLKMEGMPNNNTTIILEVLTTFEALHPNLEILDSDIEFEPKNEKSPGRIYGIWIDHRPKMNLKADNIE